MTGLTKNCRKIIIFLGNRAEEKFFAKELSDRLKISLGGTHNALKYLVDRKIIGEEKRGNMRFYQADDENPIIRQEKIAAALETLMLLAERLKEDAKEVILFGSASRGEQTKDSDIDLFVLTHHPEIVKSVIQKYAKSENIKAVVKTPNQWAELELKEPEFYNEVKGGIKII